MRIEGEAGARRCQDPHLEDRVHILNRPSRLSAPYLYLGSANGAVMLRSLSDRRCR
jgi:hypothetical protein